MSSLMRSIGGGGPELDADGSAPAEAPGSPPVAEATSAPIADESISSSGQGRSLKSGAAARLRMHKNMTEEEFIARIFTDLEIPRKRIGDEAVRSRQVRHAGRERIFITIQPTHSTKKLLQE